MAAIEFRERRVGSAAVFDALLGIEFPADKQDVLRQAGNKTIEYKPGLWIELARIIEQSKKSSFLSMLEISQEIGEILKRGKDAAHVA